MLDHDVKQFRADKILKHLDRVQAWIEEENPFPVTMELDMTDVCNHRCPECVVNYVRESSLDTLPRELAERVVRELGGGGVRGLIFTGGGEPLCHPDTLDMIPLARQSGMDVALITNGSLLDDRAITRVLEHCVWVRVSLDAIRPDTFQAMHGAAEHGFRKVTENIKRLAEAKKRLGAATTVGVGFLTCEKTAGEIELAAETCADWGVDYIQFRPLQIHHGGNFSYDWRNVEEEIERACKHSRPGYDVLYSKHKYQMIRRRDYGRDYGQCHGQQFASTIAANGKVYVCCHLRGYEKYCLGDLREQSFAEIWHSERRRQVIASIDFRDCIPLCRDNTFNQILWQIRQPRSHVNFL